jgi:serpin B
MRQPLFGTAVAALVGLAGLAGCNGFDSRAVETAQKTAEENPEGGPPVAWSADMQIAADGGNQFACDLYGKLRDKDGNLFFSPYSIHTALAMTAAGARGTTRDQMVRVLHLPADEAKALATGDLGRFYTTRSAPYTLTTANALWGQKGYPWRPEFLATLKERFGAGAQEADFATQPEVERTRINRWVEEKTQDRIKNLLQAGQINELTRLVLTNAIYFKGAWTEEFKPANTQEAPFRLATGGTVPVPLMHRKGRYAYTEGEGFQAVAMPYKGDDLAMIVVLPREPGGLPAVEKQLTAENLARWIAKMTQEEVQLSLPRFRSSHRFEPDHELRVLGMIDAYDPAKADFSGMVDTAARERLSVSKVVHQSFVDVNEEGTEAAAATAVVLNAPSPVPPPPKVFRADRPFVYLIRDTRHGTILFLGRLTNPKA